MKEKKDVEIEGLHSIINGLESIRNSQSTEITQLKIDLDIALRLNNAHYDLVQRQKIEIADLKSRLLLSQKYRIECQECTKITESLNKKNDQEHELLLGSLETRVQKQNKEIVELKEKITSLTTQTYKHCYYGDLPGYQQSHEVCYNCQYNWKDGKEVECYYKGERETKGD